MALVVVPLHLLELFVIPDPTGDTRVSCKIQVFFHLFVVSVRSWSTSAFILLHHLHDGIIPSSHSIIALAWTWIMSGLLVIPTIVVPGSLVDFEECSLRPENYGMTVYAGVTLFFLPALILTPAFIKWSKLSNQFTLRRDISADFLDIDMDEDDDNNEIGKY